MSLCSDISKINAGISLQNYKNSEDYVKLKKEKYEHWYSLFNSYDSETTNSGIPVSENDVIQAKNKYYSLPTPDEIPEIPENLCKNDNVILFPDKTAINPYMMTNFIVYNNVGFDMDPLEVFDLNNDGCQRKCINNINCVAFTQVNGKCNIFTSMPTTYVKKEGQLFIKKDGVMPGASIDYMDLALSYAEIAGVVVGLVVLLVIIILLIYFLRRVKGKG
jgi:hypothetical protein